MASLQSLDNYLRTFNSAHPLSELSHQHTIICANIQQTQLFSNWVTQQYSRNQDAAILPNVISLNQWLETRYLNQPSTHKRIIQHNLQLMIWNQAIISEHDAHLSESLAWNLASQYHHYYQHEIQFNHQNHSQNDVKYNACKQHYLDTIHANNLIDHTTLEHSFPLWESPDKNTFLTFVGFNLLTPSLKRIIDHHNPANLFVFQNDTPNAFAQCHKIPSELSQIDYLTHRLLTYFNEKETTNLGIILPKHTDYQNFILPAIHNIQSIQPELTSALNEINSLIPQPLLQTKLVQSLNLIFTFYNQPSTTSLLAIFRHSLFHLPTIPTSSYQHVINLMQAIPFQHLNNPFYRPSQCDGHIETVWSQITALIDYQISTPQPILAWKNWFKSLIQDQFSHYIPQSSHEDTLFRLWLHTIIQSRMLPKQQDQPISCITWKHIIDLHLNNTYASQHKKNHSGLTILSWSHAIDMPFDELIFVSNHSDNWPAALPSDIPKDNSSAFWSQIHEQLHRSSRKITFLYPLSDAQQQPLLPSPLLAHDIHTQTPSIKKLAPFYTMPRQTTASKRELYGPSLTDAEYTISTSVLQSYSRCHAQGFLHHRLHIRNEKTNSYGIDALDIGNLVHAALQKLDDVCQSTPPDAPMIATTIDDLFKSKKKYQLLSAVQKDTLHKHLYQTLSQWFDYRCKTHQKDPVTRCSHEVSIKQSLFGVHFNLRIDRLDQYPDGSYRIIDYKTGLSNRADWLSARPQNPQLIIYALCIPSTTSIAYASLNPDHYGYSGYGHSSDDINGIKPISSIVLSSPDAVTKTMNSWPKQISMWQNSMKQLVSDYQSSSLQTNPHAGSTCNFCQLQSVCRYYEHSTSHPEESSHA